VDAAGVTKHDADGVGVFGKLADPSDPAYQIDDPLNPGQKMTRVTGGPLEALARVRDSLRNNDTEAIDQSLADLDDAIDVALVQRVAVGARTRHLEAVKDQLDDQNTKLEEILSNIQDADFAKLVVEVNQNDLVYQASLLTSSKILQVSLLNYL
jgi:flagellar hook-associated protein 3 FlgL